MPRMVFPPETFQGQSLEYLIDGQRRFVEVLLRVARELQGGDGAEAKVYESSARADGESSPEGRST